MGGRVGWGGACRAGDTPVISSRYYNCHFEPKARNLAFPSPAVLRDRSGAVETANCFGSRDSLYSKSVLLAPYPLLSPDSGGASARRCSGQEDKRLRQPSRPLSCPPRGAPLPNWGRGGGVGKQTATQRPERQTVKKALLAAVTPTARCPSPQWGEGEGALPQKIARFAGDPSVGLEGRGVSALSAAPSLLKKPVSPETIVSEAEINQPPGWDVARPSCGKPHT